jgi:hypothetical protein
VLASQPTLRDAITVVSELASSRVWKRRAGSFSRSFFKENYDRPWNILEFAQAVRMHADADTSPQREYLGMVFGRSPLPERYTKRVQIRAAGSCLSRQRSSCRARQSEHPSHQRSGFLAQALMIALPRPKWSGLFFEPSGVLLHGHRPGCRWRLRLLVTSLL